jgi:hypothetical protein
VLEGALEVVDVVRQVVIEAVVLAQVGAHIVTSYLKHPTLRRPSRLLLARGVQVVRQQLQTTPMGLMGLTVEIPHLVRT